MEQTPFSPYSMNTGSRYETMPPECTPEPSAASKRLKIDALLNPVIVEEDFRHALPPQLPPPTNTPTLTPSSATDDYSTRSTPFHHPHNNTPRSVGTMSSSKARRRAKADRTTAPVKNPVHFPPRNDHASMMAVSQAVRDEIDGQFRVFTVKPDRRIYDCPKTYPYSSSKKSIFHQTAKKGFEVFEYSFRMPDDSPSTKSWVVMWDYQVGLVRMTAFFKALGFRKTVPKEAIAENPPLHEYCLSVTGGALDAQGYWMPYDCARALCATFCHKIRYALIPVFGVDFINDCLTPDQPNYQKWKIDPNLVRLAASTATAWNSEPGAVPAVLTRDENNTSDSDRGPGIHSKKLRTRKITAITSPVGSDSDDAANEPEYVRSARLAQSPQLSPKSRPPLASWTSINEPPFTGNATSRRARPDPIPAARNKRRRSNDDEEQVNGQEKGLRGQGGDVDVARVKRVRHGAHGRAEPQQSRARQAERSESDDEDIVVPASRGNRNAPWTYLPPARMQDPHMAAEILLNLRHSSEYPTDTHR